MTLSAQRPHPTSSSAGSARAPKETFPAGSRTGSVGSAAAPPPMHAVLPTFRQHGAVGREVLRAVPVREYGAEQPVGLAVDPVGEVEGIGIAVIAADPEIEGPKPARRVALADVDPDRPAVRSGRRVEGIDSAIAKAEVADQQMIDESAEARWRQGHSPGRGGCR